MKERLKYVLVIAGGALLLLLLASFNARVAELNRLRRTHQQVSTQLVSLQETQMVLQTQVAYATSEAAVLEHAYQEDRMVRPGDVLVVPLAPSSSTPTPTPFIAPVARQRAPWEYWFALFFGESP